MSRQKKIGILTSGGDCSGLNSVIRASYIRAKILGYEMIGIRRGLKGLIEPIKDIIKMEKTFADESLLTKSGSVLLSNTKTPKKGNNLFYSTEESAIETIKMYKKFDLDALIYIGGDGSLSIVNIILSKNSNDINIIAIPKTIDNDVEGTDVSIGFTTAVEVAAKAIEKVRDTAISHERVMVVEVMGREAGFIALHSGIVIGADVILIPEFHYDINKVIKKVQESYNNNKNHCIIIVSEAVEASSLRHSRIEIDPHIIRTQYNGIGEHIASVLRQCGFDSRAVILGHIQRGGSTSVLDRIVGSGFGTEAINTIDSGESNVMLVYQNNMIKKIPIKEAIKDLTRCVTKHDMCVKIAKDLGIYIGEV